MQTKKRGHSSFLRKRGHWFLMQFLHRSFFCLHLDFKHFFYSEKRQEKSRRLRKAALLERILSAEGLLET